MITSLYAAILAGLYICLSIYVVKGRYKHRVILGDGNIPDMTARIRSHANFAEYVPFALLLLFLVDRSNVMPWVVHLLGLMLLIGRILHAIALNNSSLIPYARPIGMVLTLAMILLCAFLLLFWEYLAMTLIEF